MFLFFSFFADVGKDHLESLRNHPHRVLGGIISPAHDAYAKPVSAISSSRGKILPISLHILVGHKKTNTKVVSSPSFQTTFFSLSVEPSSRPNPA